jgi:hypothetical protein
MASPEEMTALRKVSQPLDDVPADAFVSDCLNA